MTSLVIDDDRSAFSKSTFTGFKKASVLKELEKAIHLQNKSDAFDWTGDLLCTGCVVELWNLYIYIMCKYVHINSPRLPMFIDKKFKEFKELSVTVESDLSYRNNNTAKAIFFSITLLLCECNKDTILEFPKFNFEFSEVYSNLKATKVTFIQPFFQEGDPKEVFIPMNELAYHLFETKNKKDALYWIEWILGYDQMMAKRKTPLKCKPRPFMKPPANVVWMIWELLLKRQDDDDPSLQRIMEALCSLFSIKYTAASNMKKVHILTYAVMLVIHKVNLDVKIVNNAQVFADLDELMTSTYARLKKHEKKT